MILTGDQFARACHLLHDRFTFDPLTETACSHKLSRKCIFLFPPVEDEGERNGASHRFRWVNAAPLKPAASAVPLTSTPKNVA